MAERPRAIWIGSDTRLRAKGFRNMDTNAIITGATGTVEIWKETDMENVQLMPTITLTESTSVPGTYEGLVAFNHPGLTEGLRLQLVWFLDGGAGQRQTRTMKAVAKHKTDDGL